MAKSSNQSLIHQKQIQLESFKQTLKEEFVGIDSIIDSIITSVSAWYTFPQAYQRPLVINLWGLTGIGKTSLVNRLVELMKMEKRYIRFNLSEKEDDFYRIKHSLSQFTRGANKNPLVIALDEFQNFRTLDEMRRESPKIKSQIIWDLIDSGKIQYTEYAHDVHELRELLTRLNYCLSNGVKVKNGKITRNINFFYKVMQMDTVRRHKNTSRNTEDLPWFIPVSYDSTICENRIDLFNEPFLVRDHLKTLDAKSSIEFIRTLLEDLLKPRTIDCSNSLIFVLGNLDEAYTMSDNFNPDMSADEFYQESTQISLTQIKTALKHRFRNEQIARLGNNHLIYPSLNRKSYEAFISLELLRLSVRVKSISNLETSFSASVNEFIYSEGVFPTQGCRPVLSTIYQFLHSKLGLVHYLSQSLKKQAQNLHIDFEDSYLIFEFKDQKKILIHSHKTPLKLNMASLRKEPQDETQAITAVHEAGHALLSITLLNTIPEYVYSVTADAEAGGFTLSKPTHKYRSKAHIKPRLAMMLGGYLAEKLIFGEEHLTTGSESDIYRATSLASQAVKTFSFGSKLGCFNVKSALNNLELFDLGTSLQMEIKALLNASEALATEQLTLHKKLLLAFANCLKDHRMLKKEAMQNILQETEPDIYQKIVSGLNANFYRDTLAQKTQETLINSASSESVGKEFFSLNKSKN